MGLDVYLNYCENWEEYQMKQELYSDKTTRIWEEIQKGRTWETLTQDEKDSANSQCKEYAASLGLGEWGGDNSCSAIEINSKKYPKHYFKVGYFRSSYNDGGINRVLSNNLGENSDLYYIFNVTDNYEYYFTPDWKLAFDRVREVRRRLKERIKETGGAYCFSVWHYKDHENVVSSGAEAIQRYIQNKPKEKSKNKPKEKSKNKDFYSYSNIDGYFSMDKPIEVYAIIQGKSEYKFTGEQQETYVVAKDKTKLKFYVQALDIIEETINYVLAQPNSQNYRLSWSA